jgi:hypothetical protein
LAYAGNSIIRRNPVPDLVFLVIGAVFLAACGLYALACEQL